MGPSLAYLIVIAVWATTPLAIKISSQGFSPLAAASMRFVLASLLACVIVALVCHRSGLKRRHWKAYAAASLSIFPNMPLVYLATTYISSGLVSVMFATAPLIMGLLSVLILKKNPFTPLRLLGLGISLSGLMLISYAQFGAGDARYIGILLMIGSTVLFSLSNILLKKMDTSAIDPLEQSLGAMVFALPGLLLCWYVLDGQIPAMTLGAASAAIVYLATVGSLLGFMAFYYVLRQLPFEVVGLVPLITPVLAMFLGVLLAGESIGRELQQGSLLILTGLAVYEFLPGVLRRLRGKTGTDTAIAGANRKPLVVVGGGVGAAQNQ